MRVGNTDAHPGAPGPAGESRTRDAAPGGASASSVVLGDAPLSIAALLQLARGEARAELSSDPAWRERMEASREQMEKRLAEGHAVYGVTTGVGSSVGNQIPAEERGALALNLVRMHGCGTGRILDQEEAAAVVAARLATLVRGHSGVRRLLVERLCVLLNERVLPRIPAEGSVGASGDLTPLSYLAAVLQGEREVTFRGRTLPAAEAWGALGLEPLELSPRETLALMNGTSTMTALAALAFARATALARLAASVTGLVSDVTRGNPDHFDARLFELKPHPGSQRAAGWIRTQLAGAGHTPARLQDRYSVRCAPHVIGVLVDALDHSAGLLEVEINGVDDNPAIDPESGDILHGGNFYGGHVCFAMDSLKAALASVADLLDRQLALVCHPETNAGMPENLVAGGAPSHHGFKAMQISASALAAEALKLSMPAAAFSRSTESHNQDKVSMGTIAARDCLRVVELCEGVAAIGLLAAVQGVDLRGPAACSPGSRALHGRVREHIPMLGDDRRQDRDIASVLELHRAGAFHPDISSADGSRACAPRSHS